MKKLIFFGVLGLFILASCNSTVTHTHNEHDHEAEGHNHATEDHDHSAHGDDCLLYTSPSPRDRG